MPDVLHWDHEPHQQPQAAAPGDNYRAARQALKET